MKKFLCAFIFLIAFALAPALKLEANEPRTLSVVIFPVKNSTGLEIWESKYYPYNVLEQKMAEYLEVLYKRSPLIEVRVLDEAGMNRWLSSSRRRADDMAIQLEMYEARLKAKHVVGTYDSGRVQIRMKIYNSSRGQNIATRTVQGKDQRFTFDDDESIFWLDAAEVISLPIPFENGLDLFGLTQNYKGQKMSRLTWEQFKNTSHWQAIKNAIYEAFRQSMNQITNVIHSNEPNSALAGTDTFSPSFSTIGRILAPTATSTRKRREYIISVGSLGTSTMDGVRVGEILEVVRGETYVTVDPENPVVVLPKVIGRVKVMKVYDQNAIVRVIQDNKKEPITLKDIVIKKTSMLGK